MKVIVFLNERSGACATQKTSNLLQKIERAFADAGVEASIRCVAAEQLADEARAAAASGVDAVVAGGGDGTISAVAGALAGGDVPLGVLPLGTLNHFAKDLGLPLDLAGAAGVIAQNHAKLIDVGRVNDRVFINNSSLGVYALALIDRDDKRRRLGWAKWPAMISAAVRIFWRSPLVRVELETADGAQTIKTPLVFIGNNRYLLDLLRVGKRASLDGGDLSLYYATSSNRWGMFKILVRGLAGRLRQSRDFQTCSIPRVSIDARRRRLAVALDGEVLKLPPPLHYAIWPQALRVLAPAGGDDAPQP